MELTVPRQISNQVPHVALLPDEDVALPRHDLIFFNGAGGFTPDGREYIITTTADKLTPAPWVNVLANPTSAQ